jgi:hypothetical protein
MDTQIPTEAETNNHHSPAASRRATQTTGKALHAGLRCRPRYPRSQRRGNPSALVRTDLPNGRKEAPSLAYQYTAETAQKRWSDLKVDAQPGTQQYRPPKRVERETTRGSTTMAIGGKDGRT